MGLYTSPHLVDFRERIRINGEMIPQQAVVDFVTQTIKQSDNQAFKNLSFFEMTVGMAFDYFAKEKVDIAVVEVGMGGRLDSTNVIMPELSIITNIGLDHTQFLGDTLEKIAAEKAGIIKDGVPVVIGETQAETKPVFDRVAAEHYAPITYADQKYRINDECGMMNDELMTFTVDILRGNSSFLTPHSSFTSQLTGEYQKKNIATVLEAVEVLKSLRGEKSKSQKAEGNSSTLQLFDSLTPAAVRQGLARVVTNTHLHGRWQKIGEAPLTICETAHNEPGIRSMLGKLQTMQFKRLHLVYGCVNDKDFRHILQLLISQFSTFNFQFSIYFSQPSVPRKLPVADLVAAAKEMGIEGQGYDNVKEAIAAARSAADKDDLVLVTGSIFLVADALATDN